MEDLRSGTAQKLREVLQTVAAEQDKSIRNLREDVRIISQFAKSKVKDIQDRRRHKQQLPAAADLVLTVNQGAGAELLTHFKNSWYQIHQDTINSAQKAETAYGDMQILYKKMSDTHQIITHATRELASLPNTLKAIEDTYKQVEELATLVHDVESSLLEHISVTARLETERSKHSAKMQLEKYREEKDLELRKLEGVVSEEKRLTLERQRQFEERTQQERQNALKSMFDQQMAEYREKGEVEKPLLSEDVVRGRAFSEQSVEDVDIEDEIGDEQLKDFLSDVEDGLSDSKDDFEENKPSDDVPDDPDSS